MSFLRCHPPDSSSELEFGNTFNKGEEFPIGTEAKSLDLRRSPSCLQLCHVLDDLRRERGDAWVPHCLPHSRPFGLHDCHHLCGEVMCR